jgi:hypothetical protein
MMPSHEWPCIYTMRATICHVPTVVYIVCHARVWCIKDPHRYGREYPSPPLHAITRRTCFTLHANITHLEYAQLLWSDLGAMRPATRELHAGVNMRLLLEVTPPSRFANPVGLGGCLM